jgi:uncharacterized cupredoxin-like copper-binding protein
VLVLASTDITAFHVIGAIFAIWAVVVAGLGVMKKDFPGKTGETLVVAVTAVLMLGTVGSAIATSGEEEPKGEEIRDVPAKEGKEGSEAPEGGGTPAPDTAPESGQEEAGETGQDAPEGTTRQRLTLSTEPSGELAFDKTELEAETGNVTIAARNPAPVPHNVAIEGDGVDEEGPVVEQGGTSEVSAELQPGEYTFYCSVPGHREAGMEGALTVK